MERLRFDVFEESEDFASIAVICLLQDRTGFIWVGTRDGLYRYDGILFKEYRADDGKAHGLGDNWIERLFEDSSGRMWLASRQGLTRYDAEKDRFYDYALEGDDGSVKGFAENDAGELIVLAESGGLYRFDESGTFKLMVDGLPGISKSLTWDESLGYLVGGTEGVQIVGRDFALSRFFPLGSMLEGTRNFFVGQVERVSDWTLWLGTSGAGAWMLDLESGDFSKLETDSKDDDFVGSLKVEASGKVLVGTTAGLRVYEPDGRLFHDYEANEYDKESIQAGTVYALLSDRQGNLWVGSSRGGLSVARNAKAFYSIRNLKDDPLGLTKQKVNAIFVDSKERLWVGYHNEGMDRIDYGSRRKTYFDPHLDQAHSLGRGTVWDIRETEDGSIWVGSNRSGLLRLAPGSDLFESYVTDADDSKSIGGMDTRVILPDEKGNLWLALHGVGVDYFDRELGVFDHYDTLTRDWVEDLALDEAGNLWVATSDGLSFLAKGSREFVDFSHDAADVASISDRHVMCLYFDSDGTLWVGTRNGLCSLVRGGDRFRRYGFAEGLPSMSIRSVVETLDGEVWVATAGGLARFDRSAGAFQSFNKSDGLISNEFVDRARFLKADGVLMLGTEKGIVAFDPSKIVLDPIPPEVAITGVHVLNVPLEISDERGSVLREAPYLAERIVFPAGQTTFGFSFSALDFAGSGQNEYQYLLDGFDGNWIQNGGRSDCSYTNIPPGEYVFRVRASNGDGVWSERGASLGVVVLPFFWQTVWFRFLVLVALVVGVVVVFKIRVANLARQKTLLLEKVSERTKDLRKALSELEVQKNRIEDQNLELLDHRENLEELILQRTSELVVARDRAEESDRLKSAFLENITHEIRTPMNAIIGFVSVLRAGGFGDEEREEYLRIIEENGDYLTALIDDILELSLLESEKVALVPIETDMAHFLQKCFGYLSNKLEMEGKTEIRAELKVEPNLPSPFLLRIDSVRLEQVLKNLLDNAVKFTDRGVIFISCDLKGGDLDTLTLGVTDTGVGIPKDKQASIFKRFRKIMGERKRLYRGTGLGLAIVQRIVELMEGVIVVDSVVGEGSRFTITIPVSTPAQIEGEGGTDQLRIQPSG